jgi:hypothetical protein
MNWFFPERCRTCDDDWPCLPRRLAGTVIRERAASAS